MPLLGINLAGLALAALWLVSLGQMQVIWIGLMMLFFSPVIIPLILIPAGVFSHFMSLYQAAKRADRERLMLLLSLGYIILFLAFWCTGIFEYVTHSIAPHATAAGVLWASTAALVPLLWWSRRDAENVFIMMMVEMTQVAMIAVSVLRLFRGESSFWMTFGILAGFLAFVAAMQSVYEKKFMNRSGAGPH